MNHLMNQHHTPLLSRVSAALLLSLSLSLLMGLNACTPTYVSRTKVPYSPERQEVADLIERYRVALEQRDMEAIKAMTSEGYYENASTTDDPSDDYDRRGLLAVLDKMKTQVKAVKYNVKITQIEVLANAATVDVEYTGQYLFTFEERDRWKTHADKNRLTLRREEGAWKIVSGL